MNRRHLSLIAPAVIILMAAVAYYPGLKGEFVVDDIGIIAEAPFYTDRDIHFKECWGRPYGFKGSHSDQYRPVTVASFWLNTTLFGLSSPSFRVINLLLHVAVALLVLKLGMVLRMGKTSAFGATLLFTVHPLISEAVIPAVGRSELLCLFFILAGLIIYIKFGFPSIFSFKADKVQLDSTATINDFAVRAFLPAMCLVFACWSKESGIILLPLCLLYDIVYRDLLKFPGFWKWFSNNVKRFLLPYCVFIFVLAIVVFYRITGTGALFSTLNEKDHWLENPLVSTSAGVRILTALKVQGIVLGKFFLPKTLSHDYSYAQILPVANFADVYIILAFCMLILLPVILCLILPKRKKTVIFLCLAYLFSILAVGNFITPAETIFRESAYYSPMVWLCLIFAYSILRISQKFRYGPLISLIFLFIVAVTLTSRTWKRTEDWKNQMNIALAGISTSPKSVKTWSELAMHFAREEQFDKAIGACNIALKIYPEHQQTLINRAYYNIALDNFSMAEKDFRQLISLGYRDPVIFNKLGAILASTRRKPEAAIMWKHSLIINPYQPEIKKVLRNLKE